MTVTPTALRDLGQWTGGGTPSKSRPEFWAGGTVPWLSPKDMGPITLTATQDRITEAAMSGSSVRAVAPGSVAVVVRSGILERTLPVALVPFETTLNQDMKALTPGDGVDPRYVAWALRADEHSILRDARKAGTTVASLEWPRFLAHQIPMRSLEEQGLIVELIEEHLSHLAAADASLTLASRRLAVLCSSILEPEWRAISARTPIGEIGTILTGTTPKRDDLAEATLPFLTPGDISHGGRILHVNRHIAPASGTSVRLVNLPAVHVVCVGATLGKVGWTDYELTMNQQINSVLLPEGQISPQVLAGLLAAPSGQAALSVEVSATTMPILNKAKFSRVPVPRLSAEDVQYAERRLHASLDGAQRLQQTLSASDERFSALRRAVLAAAFSGRLTGASADRDVIDELAYEPTGATDAQE